MEYAGYERNPLDDYTMSELIDEIERRKERIEKREKVERVVDDILNNVEKAEVTGKADTSGKVVYTFVVQK